eukprot:TRINITY_DN2249_c0_g1_i2.p1 TRINITY_DN2249_c0_g1~~TRINITY_DN2249_c0_g1_i2.p1  ORF type:complete len:234 (+),score=-32.97 TRINITY_DN2249_c0_g1_i2:31-732(+)
MNQIFISNNQPIPTLYSHLIVRRTLALIQSHRFQIIVLQINKLLTHSLISQRIQPRKQMYQSYLLSIPIFHLKKKYLKYAILNQENNSYTYLLLYQHKSPNLEIRIELKLQLWRVKVYFKKRFNQHILQIILKSSNNISNIRYPYHTIPKTLQSCIHNRYCQTNPIIPIYENQKDKLTKQLLCLSIQLPIYLSICLSAYLQASNLVLYNYTKHIDQNDNVPHNLTTREFDYNT